MRTREEKGQLQLKQRIATHVLDVATMSLLGCMFPSPAISAITAGVPSKGMDARTPAPHLTVDCTQGATRHSALNQVCRGARCRRVLCAAHKKPHDQGGASSRL